MSDFNTLDLDSLDALLDAAEVAPEGENTSETPKQEGAADEVGDTQAVSAATETLPEVEATAPETPLEVPVTAQEIAEHMPLKAEVGDRKAIPKKSPPSLKSKSTAQWTDADMDAIKKLVIIFGSILIVLMLIAIGLATGSLLSEVKTDPKLLEQVEEVKSSTDQSYLLIEDSGKQAKTMSGQLSDVATQLAEIAEAIEILKNKQALTHTTANTSGKPLSAAEKKAALREEIQHRLAGDGDALTTDHRRTEETDESNTQQVADVAAEKNENNIQVAQMGADISDVKKRLIATQKVLENLQKQSELLQQQSQLLTDTLKNVETDVKALKPVKVSAAPKVIVRKQADVSNNSRAQPVVPTKPADDPDWRARWSQQMGKSEGFP